MAISFGKQNSKYKQYGYPNFLLDFAKTKSLIESINKNTPVTFTRASSVATYVGADGLIKRAATNLALYSEEFDQWSLYDAGDTVTLAGIDAPDGKTTSWFWAPDSTVNAHILRRSHTFLSGVTYTLSAFIKYGGRQYVEVSTGGSNFGYPSRAYRAAVFDLQNGVVNFSPTSNSAKIEDYGNGWYRCSVTINIISGASGFFEFYHSDSPPDVLNTNVSDGDGISGVYIWGAQLEEGTVATPYIKTTSTVSGAPRFDHDPVTGESLGLLVEEARTNDIASSEVLSSFSAPGATIGSNELVSPDGLVTADKLKEDSSNGYHRVDFIASTGAHTISFFAKSGERNIVYSYLLPSPEQQYAFFDLNSGTVLSTSGVTNAYMEEYPNGWYRCVIVRAGTGFSNGRIGMTTTDGVFQYSGTTGEGLYLWGIQQEDGATFPSSYIPTAGTSLTRAADVAAVQDEDFATTNLLAYSESFDVGWTRQNLQTVTADVTVAPDGQTTADAVVPVSGTGTYRGLFASTTSANPKTLSAHVKKGAAPYAFLLANGGLSNAWFDLTNGTVGTVGPNLKGAYIQSLDDGWFRISVTRTSTTGPNVGVYFSDSDGSISYTGDGSTVAGYLWGASLTETEYPVDYVTTRNLLTDSQDFERASWVKSGYGSASTPSVTDDAATAPDGTQTADEISLTLNGGTSSSDIAWIYQNTSLPASTTYTLSAWVKAKTASDVGKQMRFGFASYASTTTITLTDSWQRVVVTQTTSGAALYSSGFRLRGTETNQPVDFYVWGAQTEPGTTATDYVRTVDVVGKDYRWYEPTEGTVFVEGKQTALGGARIVYFDDSIYGSGNVASMYFNNTANRPQLTVYDPSGNLQVDLQSTNAGSIAANQYWRIVYAVKKDNFAIASNGNAAQKDTNGSMFLPVYMRLGSNLGGSYLNGHIKLLAYWNTRKADSVLQGLTSGSFE